MERVNFQNPRPYLRDHDGEDLQFHSIFRTIQGEGVYSGHLAIFVRLAHCIIDCPLCDTEYTEGAELKNHNWIVDYACRLARPTGSKGRAKLVVITGGEPFRQNLMPLIKLLNEYGFIVQIESNGVLIPQHSSWLLGRIRQNRVAVMISPKTPKISSFWGYETCFFKYVIDGTNLDPTDGLPIVALGYNIGEGKNVARPPLGYENNIYVTPMDVDDNTAYELNIQAATNSAMLHNYVVQLQIHKYLKVD